MTPTHALSLSFEGIGLLERRARGWVRLADVALDAPDLDGALDAMRAQVAGDGAVRLVIPNEQIRYLDLADPGGDDAARADAARTALDGATPYAVDDLAIDWTVAGGRLFVAAVARETLDEAEEFAKGHGFVPAAHVARPVEGNFPTEVIFGAAADWTGAEPERDPLGMVIVDEPADEAEPVVEDAADTHETVEAAEEPVEDKATRAEPDAAVEKDAPGAAEEPAPEASAEPEPAPEEPAETGAVEEPSEPPEPEPAPEPQRVEESAKTEAADAKPKGKDAPEPNTAPEPAAEAEVLRVPPSHEAAPATAFASVRASRDEPAPPTAETPKLGGATAAPPRDTGARITPLAQSPEKAAAGVGVTAPAVQAPETEGKGGFFSRRRADKADKADKAGTEPKPAKAPPPVAKKTARPKAAEPAPGPAPIKPKPATPDAAAQDERRRMTVFGARDATQVGGKPRYLGLILTAVLLLVLAGVAAWASVFLDNGLARFFKSDRPVAVAELPTVEEVPVVDEAAADVELAALDADTDMAADTDTVATAPEALSQVERPRALTAEEAETTYAATGIWQRAPTAPLEPLQTEVDDLYVASIDRRVEQFDAVALPAPQLQRNDTPIEAPRPPLGPGVTFDLDERGLVRATPEGALNPDGVRIFSGRPPAVPPARPDDARLPEDAGAVDTPDLVQTALSLVRPNLRPENLIEQNERATLGGISRSELSAMRPRLRPETVKQAAEEDTTATERAVDRSRTPISRPRNFAAIVQEAETSPPEPTQVAAVAPRTVAPSIPSSASVTREATVRNAINLRRLNLIGVYGTASSRRALVRLANGRYQKVEVGDRIDGGRVTAIGEAELRYSKGGRNVVLKMPKG
ncbi:hypothetical protein [Aestuariicoccus sp. MJ-SS9]|uniref:hypothetical protein n=1 Tax=Aestuariicoccus sp. MJ-SS9 TaxID=3079855 RepID=UPI00290ACFC6|nr:hypothetical protein [Aestuariicoccus sp. MJ-SS9]MDU8912879.1 hypothetical protein [Aestuariicoccus sp. MJ-SS9]